MYFTLTTVLHLSMQKYWFEIVLELKVVTTIINDTISSSRVAFIAEVPFITPTEEEKGDWINQV